MKTDKNQKTDPLTARLDQIGMSKAEFARQMGTKPQNVDNWRKRSGGIPARERRKAAKVLRMTLDDLDHLYDSMRGGTDKPLENEESVALARNRLEQKLRQLDEADLDLFFLLASRLLERRS